MTVMDKMNSGVKSITHALFDREYLTYLEATAAYSIVGQGRLHNAQLSIMYNHARDPELKKLVLQALEEQNKATLAMCEKALQENGGELPHMEFEQRRYHDEPLDIPHDARMTDQEIILTLATMAKASQMTLLTALQHCYQPNIAMAYRDRLDESLDFAFRILQLALNRGWLPHMGKVH